jgi:ribosomal protein S18 acetylase RimI-like enzyme
LGTTLMHAAEREAVRRGCHQIVLSAHSFQAPRFYDKLGFRRLAAISNYPRGHENIIYIKYLSGASGTEPGPPEKPSAPTGLCPGG